MGDFIGQELQQKPQCGGLTIKHWVPSWSRKDSLNKGQILSAKWYDFHSGTFSIIFVNGVIKDVMLRNRSICNQCMNNYISISLLS